MEEYSVKSVPSIGGKVIRRLKEILSFKKPKGPGLTISKGCYLTVLAAKAHLPALLEVVSPKGEGNTVKGMGVPLASGTQKEDLSQPMQRGVYAIASTNQKTMLKLMIMPKEEAGFDPGAFARSKAAELWGKELRTRVESTWMVLQLTFESYDPAVYPALDFFLDVASKLAELTDGTVADPISKVYKLPEHVRVDRPESEPIAAIDHVQIKSREIDGGWHVYTLGLTKFEQPEVEVQDIPLSTRPGAERFVLGLAQAVLTGQTLELGALVGAKDKPLKVVSGGLDRGQWEGIPCLELIAEDKGTQAEAVEAWIASQSGS